MTLTDVQNYEQALVELEDAFASQEPDYIKIDNLYKVIAEYEDSIYKE